MDSARRRDLHHVGLATACAVIYAKITGEVLDPRDSARMQSVLDTLAHAVANIAPIYADDDPSGVRRRIPPLAIREGKFCRGAQVFTHKDGKELRGLTVQRRDMQAAIDILRSVHTRFDERGGHGKS